MNTIISALEIGLTTANPDGSLPVTEVQGVFTIATASVTNQSTITVNAGDTYLSVITLNGAKYIIVNDAGETFTGFTKIVKGTTPALTATALASALNTGGITATASSNVVTLSSSTTQITIETTALNSSISVNHTDGKDAVPDHWTLEFVSNPTNGTSISVGGNVCDFVSYANLPYGGANNLVMIGDGISNSVDNLATVLSPLYEVYTMESTVTVKALTSIAVTGNASIIATKLSTFVPATSSVSVIKFDTNAKIGDSLGFEDGIATGSITFDASLIGTTSSATATLVKAKFDTLGINATSAVASNVVTITYDSDLGSQPNEPNMVNNVSNALVSAMVSVVNQTGVQALNSGVLNAYKMYIMAGMPLLAINGNVVKEFSIVGYNPVVDGFLVAPKNGILDVAGTRYYTVKIPPVLNSLCVSGGGQTIAENSADAKCFKGGLMNDTPYFTSYTPSGSFEFTLRMTQPVKDILASAINGTWVAETSFTANASIAMQTAGNMATYTPNIYRITLTHSYLNNANMSSGLPVVFTGWAEKTKNRTPFFITSVGSNYIEISTNIVFVPESNIAVKFTLPEYIRNGTTPRPIGVGQNDKYQKMLLGGTFASSFEINSSGDECKVTASTVTAGSVDVQPNAELKTDYTPWLYMVDEPKSLRYTPQRCVANLQNVQAGITEATIKVDSTHTAEKGATLDNDMFSDAVLYPSIATFGDIIPTGTLKVPQEQPTGSVLQSFSKKSCELSFTLRFAAIGGCQGTTQAQVIFVSVPRATTKVALDSPTTTGAKYATLDYTGGAYTPTNLLTTNNKAPYAIQYAYFSAI